MRIYLPHNCPICFENVKKFVEDHDHKTGRVRGHICYRCNRGLAYFHDSQRELLEATKARLAGRIYKGEGYFPTAEQLSRAATYLTEE
jgi:hypothetical protein